MAAPEGRTIGVAVVALDRWGRVLLVRGPGGIVGVPCGAVEPAEAPDAAALRVFEEATGVTLEQLRLARVWRRQDAPGMLPWEELHLYFDDPDLDPATLPCDARAVAPGDLATLPLDDWVAAVLERFFASPAYRALFH